MNLIIGASIGLLKIHRSKTRPSDRLFPLLGERVRVRASFPGPAERGFVSRLRCCYSAFVARSPTVQSSASSAQESPHSALPDPHLPELLAPAGDWDCAKAAVENGADAIYFGLEKFNARMRANNFTDADLPKLMEFLHRRGVKGYVTFNTLVFENELADAEEYLRAIIAAGVDAAIVQDVGICRLIRRSRRIFRFTPRRR